MEDNGYVQNIGGGQLAYSRRIEPMGMADIVRLHDPDHLGEPLPPIDHQGIDHAFVGKVFEVWYYFDGNPGHLQFVWRRYAKPCHCRLLGRIYPVDFIW